jgi:hypothetical protein
VPDAVEGAEHRQGAVAGRGQGTAVLPGPKAGRHKVTRPPPPSLAASAVSDGVGLEGVVGGATSPAGGSGGSEGRPPLFPASAAFAVAADAAGADPAPPKPKRQRIRVRPPKPKVGGEGGGGGGAGVVSPGASQGGGSGGGGVPGALPPQAALPPPPTAPVVAPVKRGRPPGKSRKPRDYSRVPFGSGGHLVAASGLAWLGGAGAGSGQGLLGLRDVPSGALVGYGGVGTGGVERGGVERGGDGRVGEGRGGVGRGGEGRSWEDGGRIEG